ncbi:MAG TPA: hypothetical protein VF902_08185 [Coriobacteriia bacterium]
MRIRSVTVGPETVEAVVAFADGEPLRTSEVPDAAARALRALPGLRGHRCDNADGRSFADELSDTELAHLLEHATLEIMAMAGSPDTLRGETSWDFRADGRGVFRVRVGYDDDLVCLGALKTAAALVNALADGAPSADVDAEAAKLRRLRRS